MTPLVTVAKQHDRGAPIDAYESQLLRDDRRAVAIEVYCIRTGRSLEDGIRVVNEALWKMDHW